METFTEQEVATLKRVIWERTPLKTVNETPVAPTVSTASVAEHLDGETARARKMAPSNPEEDSDLRARIAHTMRKGEKVMEWFARVGLGRQQALSMSRDEIKRHADLADERNAQEPRHIRLLAQPEAKQLLRYAL